MDFLHDPSTDIYRKRFPAWIRAGDAATELQMDSSMDFLAGKSCLNQQKSGI